MSVTQPPKKARIFFPNLDGLRFFSFFVVYLFHVYLLLFDKYAKETEAHSITKFLFQNGELGVNFFFVLSGFLITYLLIEERKLTGGIHVGNFYVRRILRIWPLFYLCLLFGFVIYPFIKQMTGGEPFEVANPWTYFVFLNNFDFLHNGAPAIISILWSVAIEEQFYLVWPLALSLVPVKYYKHLLLAIIAGTLVFRSFHLDNERILHFHTLAVIGDMATGGLFAWFCATQEGFIARMQKLKRPVILLIYLAALVIFLFRKEIFYHGIMPVFERLIIALVFVFIILEQNFANASFFKMQNWKFISKYGTYTYGLYCLHVIGMTLVEMAFRKAGFGLGTSTFILIGVVSLPVVFIMASLSYNLFEKKFLRLKDKFAFIVKK